MALLSDKAISKSKHVGPSDLYDLSLIKKIGYLYKDCIFINLAILR
jgi:hypothetical protein